LEAHKDTAIVMIHDTFPQNLIRKLVQKNPKKERYFQLEAENRQLKAKIQELEEKLKTNSSNSSKPPSQDPFRPKRSSKPTGKKPGGQPGHPGHARQMYPLERVLKIVDLKPQDCPNCGSNTFEFNPISIECRQTVELPPIQPEITQYNIYTCRCGECGKHVRAEVPREAEHGFGPRLMGFLTMLTGEAGVSKRKICAITGHLGIKISLGGLCNIHKLAGHILCQPYEEIKFEVLLSSNVNGDESSWRLKHKKCWIWIGATPKASFFKIDPSRSQEAFKRIFEGFKNTLTTDRYGGYNCHEGNKQTCLAHIDRDCEKLSERSGVDGAIGRILCGELDSVFVLWKEFKTAAFTREQLQLKAQVHIENIKDTLTVSASAAGVGNKTAAFCLDLLHRFPTLWTFLYEEGIEPTNNLAERGLRPAVIFRKLSGGNQSEWGMRFTERVLTVACTLRQRAGNIFEYLVQSFEAHIHGTPGPPLPSGK
jgi:transposase